MALTIRTNSVPLSGALFVQNPRHRKAHKNGHRKQSTAARALIARIRASARRNGLAVHANPRLRKGSAEARAFMARIRGMKRRSNRRSAHRRNGLALRANGLAVLTNGKRRRNRKHRKNGLALRSNPLDSVTRMVSRIPVLGKIAPYLVPGLIGAASIVPVHYLLKYGGGHVPTAIRKYVAPVAYFTAGTLLGIVAQYVPFGSPALRRTFGVAAATVGAAVDVMRFYQGRSQDLGDMVIGDMVIGDMVIGDGGMYQIGVDAGAGSAAAAYSDAELGDAYYSGPDFDMGEGEGALSGSETWFGNFGVPASSPVRTRRPVSRHAGRRGHRWGWLVKLVGWDSFRQIAAMQPKDRLELIKQLRAQALQTVEQTLQHDRIEASTAKLLPNMPAQQGDMYGAALYAGNGAGAAF